MNPIEAKKFQAATTDAGGAVDADVRPKWREQARP
jgi:hypothetical protein